MQLYGVLLVQVNTVSTALAAFSTVSHISAAIQDYNNPIKKVLLVLQALLDTPKNTRIFNHRFTLFDTVKYIIIKGG